MTDTMVAAINVNALLSEAGMTVLIGLVVVFSALLVLTWVFWLFGVVAGKNKQPKATPVPTVNTVSSIDDGVSDEVVAVIAAAVAAMSDGNTRYTIRRIRPSQASTRSAWAAAGIADNTQPF